VLYHFVPEFYFAPNFYGWAYYPWPTPVVFTWPWIGAPWLGFYGPYFGPWPVYPGAPYWLTDYVMASYLGDAYQAQVQPGEAPEEAQPTGAPGPEGAAGEAYAPAMTPITPELKQAIAEEVQRQLSYESAAAGQPDQAATLTDLPQVLQPNRLFIVDTPLNVVTDDNQSCSLSGGDVLRLVARPDETALSTDLIVASSKEDDCPAEARVSVTLQDLQEMQNTFRARIAEGLKTLHDEQGSNGLPAAPLSAIGPPPVPSGYGTPAADPGASALLDQARQRATVAEQRIEESAFAPSVGSSQTPASN
jgi:hypothetical protein